MAIVPKTYISTRGDRIEVAMASGKPVLSAVAGPFVMTAGFEPAEFREMGRGIVAMADRAEGREAEPDAQQLLAELVDALNHTNWSSWQSTARFQQQLDAARALVEQVPA